MSKSEKTSMTTNRWVVESQNNIYEISNNKKEFDIASYTDKESEKASLTLNRWAGKSIKNLTKIFAIASYTDIVKLIKENNLNELEQLFPENEKLFNPNYFNDLGFSLLSVVIDSEELDVGQKLEIVKILINLKADVNKGSTTPLHLAAVNGYHEIAKVLFNAGASNSAEDSNGHTPISLAEEKEDVDMLEILHPDSEDDMKTSGHSGDDD